MGVADMQFQSSEFHIADVTVDLVRKEIRRGSQILPCGKLTFQLLVLLARNAPAIVSKEEIANELWAGRFVTPATVKRRVALLRETLGDRGDRPIYLRVVRGQGYALIPKVKHDSMPGCTPSYGMKVGLAALCVIGIFVLGAEVGYQDGLNPAIAGHQASTRIVVTSSPNELSSEDYSFVAKTASDFAQVILNTDVLQRFGTRNSTNQKTDELKSFTVLARVTNNDAEHIYVTLALPRDSHPDDRASREMELDYWSRELDDERQPHRFFEPIDNDLAKEEARNYRTHILGRAAPGRGSFLLIANLRFSRQDMLAQPESTRFDAVSTVATAIEDSLPDEQGREF